MFNCSNSMIILLVITIASVFSTEIASYRQGCSQETVMLADCLLPHEQYIKNNLRDATGREILDQKFMKKFVNFTRTLAACIDPKPACDRTRHYKYFVDALNYVGETMYNPVVFKCLEEIERPLRRCLDLSHTTYDKTFTVKMLPSQFVDILKCVTSSLLASNDVCAKRTTNKIQCAVIGIRQIVRNYESFQNGTMKLVEFDKQKMMPLPLASVICE